MENSDYSILLEQRKYLERKKKSFRQTQVLGPFIYFCMNYGFIYALKVPVEYFMVSFSVLSLLTTLLCVFVPKIAIDKLNKIVLKIEFYPEQLMLETNSDRAVLDIKDTRFTQQQVLVVNTEYDALLIDSKAGGSYHLIVGFFDSSLKNDLVGRKLL